MAALLVFIVFLVAIAITIPIGTAMALGSIAPIMFMGKGGSITQVLNNAFSGANSTPILAVPLFILGGVIMAEGGISRRLFNFFAYFVGKLKGGLPCAVIITCLFYGAISGSGPATTAAVGSMCIPFLVELGYDRQWVAGLISVAGGLGVIIPPSIPFVLYSLATNVSTGDLFKGGVLPGILIGVFMMAYAVFYCIKNGENRTLINARLQEMQKEGFWKLFKESFWALLCPIIVLGGIYTGFVTPTEAAALSVIYALVIALFVYNQNHMAFWTAIGAAPTPMAWTEVPFALQTGAIDAQENAADTCYSVHFEDVQKYLACTNHILYCNQMCVNKDFWDGLSDDCKAALEKAVADATAECSAMATDVDKTNKEALIAGGMELIEYAPEFYDEMLANEGVQALYTKIDADTNGLASLLVAELNK